MKHTTTIGSATVVALFGMALGACSDGRDATVATDTPAAPVSAPLPERETDAQRLAARVVELGGTDSDGTAKLVLGGDRFARGSGEFQAGDRIDAVAELLKGHADARLRIEGYTDDRGGAALNRRLSETRAESVRQALVERGVDASRIEVVGRGPADPVADNSTPEGRAQNRRVELTFASDGETRVASAPDAGPSG